MLARMGYKAGEALGKQTASSTQQATAAVDDISKRSVGCGVGIVEPLGIEVKTDRGGLGRAVALQQLRERRTELRRSKLQRLAGLGEGGEISTSEFRARLAQRAQERQLDADLGYAILNFN